MRGFIRKRSTLLMLMVLAVTLRSASSQSVSPDFEQRLSKADPSAFETISASRSPDELYKILTLALHHQFCGDRVNCTPGDNSDNVKSLAIGAIRRIPDHAKRLAEEIDQSSSKPGEIGVRRNNFFLLGEIASPEAIAELGRFLFDERNPEGDLPPDSGLNAVPNSLRAANAMGAALGDKPRIKSRKPGGYGPTEVHALQKWWQSPAANEFHGAEAQSIQAPHPTPDAAAKGNGQILANQERVLPTSTVNIEAATETAKSVMVCRLTGLGWIDFRGPGSSAYDEAKFDVIGTLKGEPVTKIVCSLTIFGHPLNEKAPVVGVDYLVIGDNKEGKFELQKLLTATPENIVKIQHLLSSSELNVDSSDTTATKALPARSHPAISLPKTSEKTPKAKSATPAPSEERPGSTPWSIIVVLIVAACGLLWLLLKRRG